MVAASSKGTSAADALALLLQEDPLLIQHGLNLYDGGAASSSEDAAGDNNNEENTDDAAYAYAASLLHDGGSTASQSGAWMSSSGEYRQRATEALAEVDRKLALVDSLAQRVSRDYPAQLTGPFLQLHGFELTESSGGSPSQNDNDVTTLTATRDKADRLERQSQVLSTVAHRVESALTRGVNRMESATTRLSRVLELSATLKMILRLQFEARKLGSGLDLESLTSGGAIDLRDLTRAASSVAVMEELLSHPSLNPDSHESPIDAVEKLRPGAEAIASSVRQAAAGLMNELQSRSTSAAASSLSRLGATLQVYFHLGELPDASWRAVSSALATAEKASSHLFHPTAVKRMKESAQSEAMALAEAEVAKSKDGKEEFKAKDARQRKKQFDAIYERIYLRKLREKRSAAASKWATEVSDASSRVWNLHRVLAARNDPVTRKNFLEVVAESTVPEDFSGAEERLLRKQNENKDIDNVKNTLNIQDFSVLSLFWVQFCLGLAARLQRLLKYDSGSLESDVAALYPAIRSASLEMVTELHDVMQMGSNSSDDATMGSGWNPTGVMGGSAVLEDSVFLGGSVGMDGSLDYYPFGRADEAAGGVGLHGAGADTWTHPNSDYDAVLNSDGSRATTDMAPITSSSALAVFSSQEWITLQGEKFSEEGLIGLSPLRNSFLEQCKKRLFAPLEFMFQEAVSVDENGVAVPVLPTLPSRYDLAKIDLNIREELSLADPRQGGGDFSMATMISDSIVSMVHEFCTLAKRAISDIDKDESAESDAMAHNLKVASVMSSLASFVRNAPENTFVNPYRPSQSPQHEETSHSCRVALLPALQEIESLVKNTILTPLTRVLNTQLAVVISKMHRSGAYLQNATDGNSFVQIHLVHQFDSIANTYLTPLPNEYASIVASTVATFSIYSFVSNAAMIRPLGEASRLRLTQDLADFELSLEQLVFKGGTSLSLSQIASGKPYAELRAMRQLLFWNMLEDKTLSPAEVAKALLRETWVKDVRPSTLFHFLFSFAPTLLTSPHHFKRMDAHQYVGSMIKLDGSVDDGEASAWMTTMACCDAYQQRESVDRSMTDGDRRVGAILMILGPELLRRRRQ